MTGPEHYREAERLLAEATEHSDFRRIAGCHAAAQVHATLALAAATGTTTVERDRQLAEYLAAMDRSSGGIYPADFRDGFRHALAMVATFEHIEDDPKLGPDVARTVLLRLAAEKGHDGCDCTELCEMGPTCPGGMLARLPGSGCTRIEQARAGETVDGMANDCTHGSATGIDTAPCGPEKVWRCDHCGLRWRQDGQPLARAGEGALRKRVEALHTRRGDPIVDYDCLEGDCDHPAEDYDGKWPSPECPRMADAVCAHCADQTAPDEAWEHMVRPAAFWAWEHMVRPAAFWPCATIRALAETDRP